MFVKIPATTAVTIKPYMLQPLLINGGEYSYLSSFRSNSMTALGYGNLTSPFYPDNTFYVSGAANVLDTPLDFLKHDSTFLLAQSETFTTAEEAYVGAQPTAAELETMETNYATVDPTLVSSDRYYTGLARGGATMLEMGSHISDTDIDTFLARFDDGDQRNSTWRSIFNDWTFALNYNNHFLEKSGGYGVCGGVGTDFDVTLVATEAPVDDTATEITVDAASAQTFLDTFAPYLTLPLADTFAANTMYWTSTAVLTSHNVEKVTVTRVRGRGDATDAIIVEVTRDSPEDHASLGWTDPRMFASYPPPEWTCGDDNYNSNDGCHCGCGALDPDCLFGNDEASTIGCDVGYKCSTTGTCVPAAGPNSEMFLSEPCRPYAPPGTEVLHFGGRFDDHVVPLFTSPAFRETTCEDDALVNREPSMVYSTAYCNVPLSMTVNAVDQAGALCDPSCALSGDLCVQGQLPSYSPVWDYTAIDPDARVLRAMPEIPSSTAITRLKGTMPVTAWRKQSICITPPTAGIGSFPLFDGLMYGHFIPGQLSYGAVISEKTDHGGESDMPMDWITVEIPPVTGVTPRSQYVEMKFTGFETEALSYPGVASPIIRLFIVRNVEYEMKTPSYTAAEAYMGSVLGLGIVSSDIKLSMNKDTMQTSMAPAAVHFTSGAIQAFLLEPPAAYGRSSTEYFSKDCYCRNGAGAQYPPACQSPTMMNPGDIYGDAGGANTAAWCKRSAVSVYTVEPWTNPPTVADLVNAATPPAFSLDTSGDFNGISTTIRSGDQVYSIVSHSDGGVRVRSYVTLTAEQTYPQTPATDRWKADPPAPFSFKADYLMYSYPDGDVASSALLCPAGVGSGDGLWREGDLGCSFTPYSAADIEATCGASESRFSASGPALLPSTADLSLNHTIPFTNARVDPAAGGVVMVDRSYTFSFMVAGHDVANERSFHAVDEDAVTSSGRTSRFTISRDTLGMSSTACNGTYSEYGQYADITDDLPAGYPTLGIDLKLAVDRDATEDLLDRIGYNPTGWGDLDATQYVHLTSVGVIGRILRRGALAKVAGTPSTSIPLDLDAVLGDTDQGMLQLRPGVEYYFNVKVRVVPTFTVGMFGGEDIDGWDVSVTSSEVTTVALLPENAAECRVHLVITADADAKQLFSRISYGVADFVASVGSGFAIMGAGVTVFEIYLAIKEGALDTLGGAFNRIKKCGRRRPDRIEALDLDLDLEDGVDSDGSTTTPEDQLHRMQTVDVIYPMSGGEMVME